MQRRRQQEEQARQKVEQARTKLEEERSRRLRRRQQYTPLEEANFTKRDPSPLVSQPQDPKVVECTIAGLPSAGKSSLLCSMVGHKVSATSGKVNTTVRPVVGVITKGNTQILITDTPGLDLASGSKANNSLGVKEMAAGAWDALQAHLVTLFVHDVRLAIDMRTDRVVQQLLEIRRTNLDRRLVLVLTHVDLVADSAKAPLVQAAFRRKYPGKLDEVFSVDALRGRGVSRVINYLLKRAQPGLWQFPAGCSSDQSDVQLVDNIVREKIFRRFNHELPYQIENATIGWTEMNNGHLRIDHALYVHRPTHVPLVRSGLRVMHERALRDIQGILQRNCYLVFHVVDRSGSNAGARV